MTLRKILIVDDDEVLGRVLSRVLSQQGHTVFHAANITEALQLAQQRHPDLALLDLCLPDGSGADLGRELRTRFPEMIQILMTAYPLRMSEHPELAHDFARVFTKPLDLKEIRQAVANVDQVDGAATGTAAPAASVAVDEPLRAATNPGTIEPAALPTARRPRRALIVALVGVAAVLALVFGLPLLGMPSVVDLVKARSADPPKTNTEDSGVRLVEAQPPTIEVPADVLRSLGVQTILARQATATRPLDLPGFLAHNDNRVVAVNTLFTGQVRELGQVKDDIESRLTGRTVERPVQFMDYVQKGDLLAVLDSKDLGEKKSELVDLWSLWRLDQQNLVVMEDLASRGITSEAAVRQARNNVEKDNNGIRRVQRTLRIWGIPEAEINDLELEARRILDNKGETDPEKTKLWARVEVRAPFAGLIVEKNINVGPVVDPTKDLFKIADVSQMKVVAHVYEEDLATLLKLKPEQQVWTVQVKAEPNLRLPPSHIDTVAAVIDANAHTALVIGRIDNPINPQTGKPQLLANQFITATVQLPPLANEVALPTTALVEGGRDSIIFVQPDRGQNRFEMWRVQVVRRTRDLVYIRWLRPELAGDVLGSAFTGSPCTLAAAVFLHVGRNERPDPLRDRVGPDALLVITEGAVNLLAKTQDLLND